MRQRHDVQAVAYLYSTLDGSARVIGQDVWVWVCFGGMTCEKYAPVRHIVRTIFPCVIYVAL